MKTRVPDFLGIGVMKGATSWVWQQLADHPEFDLVAPKEYHYFDTLTVSPEEYLHRFTASDSDLMTGEITPSYLTVPHAPLLAASICPKAKIFVVLRNPVERAFSHWKVSMWIEGKIPMGTPFIKAFKYGHPWGYYWLNIQERGLYYKALQRWYAAFPEDQIKILWYDDLKQDSMGFIRELYRWLGVDEDFVAPSHKEKINKSWVDPQAKIKDKDKEKVIGFYLPSIERLEKFTGRDLTSWKQ